MISSQRFKFFYNRYKFMLPLLYISSELSPKWIKINIIWELGFRGEIQKPTFTNTLNEANELGLVEFTYNTRCRKTHLCPDQCVLMRIPVKQKRFFEQYFQRYSLIPIENLISDGAECYPKKLVCPRNLTPSRSTIDELNLNVSYVPKNPFQSLITLPTLAQLVYCMLYRWIWIFKSYDQVGREAIMSSIQQITSLESDKISNALDILSETDLIIRTGTHPSRYKLNKDILPEFEDFELYFNFLEKTIGFSIDFERMFQDVQKR